MENQPPQPDSIGNLSVNKALKALAQLNISKEDLLQEGFPIKDLQGTVRGTVAKAEDRNYQIQTPGNGPNYHFTNQTDYFYRAAELGLQGGGTAEENYEQLSSADKQLIDHLHTIGEMFDAGNNPGEVMKFVIQALNQDILQSAGRLGFTAERLQSIAEGVNESDANAIKQYKAFINKVKAFVLEFDSTPGIAPVEAPGQAPKSSSRKAQPAPKSAPVGVTPAQMEKRVGEAEKKAEKALDTKFQAIQKQAVKDVEAKFTEIQRKYEDRLDQLRAENQKLVKQIEELRENKADKTAAESAIRKATGRIEDLEISTNEDASRIDDLEQGQRELSGQIKDVESRAVTKEQLDEIKEAYEKRFGELTATQQEALKLISNNKQRADFLKGLLDNEIQENERLFIDAFARIDKLDETLGENTTEIERLSEEAKKADEQLAKLRETLDRVVEDGENNTTEIERLSEEAKKADEQLAKLRETLDRVVEDGENNTTEIERLSEEAKKADEQLAKLRETLDRVVEDGENFKAELAKTTEDITKLQELGVESIEDRKQIHTLLGQYGKTITGQEPAIKEMADLLKAFKDKGIDNPAATMAGLNAFYEEYQKRDQTKQATAMGAVAGSGVAQEMQPMPVTTANGAPNVYYIMPPAFAGQAGGYIPMPGAAGGYVSPEIQKLKDEIKELKDKKDEKPEEGTEKKDNDAEEKKDDEKGPEEIKDEEVKEDDPEGLTEDIETKDPVVENLDLGEIPSVEAMKNRMKTARLELAKAHKKMFQKKSRFKRIGKFFGFTRRVKEKELEKRNQLAEAKRKWQEADLKYRNERILYAQAIAKQHREKLAEDGIEPGHPNYEAKMKEVTPKILRVVFEQEEAKFNDTLRELNEQDPKAVGWIKRSMRWIQGKNWFTKLVVSTVVFAALGAATGGLGLVPGASMAAGAGFGATRVFRGAVVGAISRNTVGAIYRVKNWLFGNKIKNMQEELASVTREQINAALLAKNMQAKFAQIDQDHKEGFEKIKSARLKRARNRTLATLAVGIMAGQNWDEIGEAASNISDYFQNSYDQASNLADLRGQSTARALFTTVGSDIGRGLSSAAEAVGDAGKAVWEDPTEVFRALGTTIREGGKAGVGAAEDLITALTNMGVGIGDFATRGADAFMEGVTGEEFDWKIPDEYKNLSFSFDNFFGPAEEGIGTSVVAGGGTPTGVPISLDGQSNIAAGLNSSAPDNVAGALGTKSVENMASTVNKGDGIVATLDNLRDELIKNGVTAANADSLAAKTLINADSPEKLLNIAKDMGAYDAATQKVLSSSLVIK